MSMPEKKKVVMYLPGGRGGRWLPGGIRGSKPPSYLSGLTYWLYVVDTVMEIGSSPGMR
jgi:hypothetical protein